MAQFEILDAYPNILLVYGTDVYHRSGPRVFDVDTGALQAYFTQNTDMSPVSRFSHDFWITHPVGTSGSYFDPNRVIHEPAPGTGGAARDFRGIVKMGIDLASLDVSECMVYFSVLLQEMGHYWLVPGDMAFDGRTVSASELFAEAFMSRASFPPLSLLGRGNDHWSSHIEANPSPLDGIGWQAVETYVTEGTRADPNILRKYAPSVVFPNTVAIPGVGDAGYVNYPDLDKVIIGAMRKEDAFSSDGNGFYELLPVWADPVNMLGGLVLVFDEAHVVTFGFSGGITKIGISQTGINYPEVWDISAFYKPWEFDSRIVFRVVRKNNDYHFQAKQELGNIGCLGTILRSLGLYTPPPATDPFEDAGMPSAPVAAPANLQRWTTLKVISSATAPIAVGYGCKTWPPETWVDMNFKPLMLKAGTNILPSIPSDPAGIRTVTGSYASSLNRTGFIFHKPTTNPRLSGDSSSCNITMNGNGDNWTGVDNMPKLLVQPPAGDFIATGSVRISRNMLAPWAAGAYTNVNLYAYRRKIQMAGLSLNAELAYRQSDPGRPYKTAFMLVADNRADITDAMVENLDKLRIASETVFSTALNRARTLDTRLRT